mmetsp:Transcript_6712/g.10271  ORF Transcript_6712/g.10271 Transcript_6712/m.10271 type:complete len:312 (-) Transcript_6712:205-1140(-)|eukprot:CAMPEP_0167754178 /NCGR_PEP_ID=MMETSP0110_2-20121227/8124_1 /TAXON_ID=629695 /ORGANISM="Gymnochlora sp., Strain CCMP2014" /LENGTH=311 /DNA_ID=CAMNT_0007640025 /DNA_START=56 /DNA_END=991 /DNA_ORIENTATION=+
MMLNQELYFSDPVDLSNEDFDMSAGNERFPSFNENMLKPMSPSSPMETTITSGWSDEESEKNAFGTPTFGRSPDHSPERKMKKMPVFKDGFEDILPSSPIGMLEEVLTFESKEKPLDGFKKKVRMESKRPVGENDEEITYHGLKYVGPTKKNKPNYKSKQEWEFDIYPHGISRQHGKFRVQIKQKGSNPTYKPFPNSLQGLLDAALFRDTEAIRLYEENILIRVPKLNFEHPTFKRRSRKARHESKSKRSRVEEKKSQFAKDLEMSADVTFENFDDNFPAPTMNFGENFFHVDSLLTSDVPTMNDLEGFRW